jgi:propanol-preferring alcohol dehydrogenase
MRAMVLQKPRQPLQLTDLAIPEPGVSQVQIQVHACAVCRTDLHIIDGELTQPKLPLIPGHEIVGAITALGNEVEHFKIGDRVGVPWLGWTCGVCQFCKSGRENLCERALFTGYTLDGGYTEYTVADHRFCFSIPDRYSDAEAAPLLCAGLIGYRSLVKTGDAHRIGIYGFGAAAHIITQVAVSQSRSIYAFTRSGDSAGQDFAKSLGAVWAGASESAPPEQLDAAIIFAPVGQLVPLALKALNKGGIVVCGGIHMSEIPAFPYGLLWQERSICSVANLTRRDGHEFFALAPQVPVRTTVETLPLAEANQALEALRHGKIKGAAVLLNSGPA